MSNENRLKTTYLKSMCEALGVDTSGMTDNLETSYYQRIIENFKGGGGSGGGATSWNDLTDKPFYEETKVVNEPLNITWDGNTEGLTEVCSDEHAPFYKVSDLVFSDEQIKKMKYTSYNTEEDNNYGECYYSDEWEGMIDDGCVTPDIVFGRGVTFVRKAGAQLFGATYPEVGVYFIKEENPDDEYLYYITSLTTTEPVEHIKLVVKKLDMKYLPEVGGGMFVIPTDADFTKVTCPVNDIRDAWQSGKVPVLIWNQDYDAQCYNFVGGNVFGDSGDFFSADFIGWNIGTCTFVCVNNDGTITMGHYGVSMEQGR